MSMLLSVAYVNPTRVEVQIACPACGAHMCAFFARHSRSLTTSPRVAPMELPRSRDDHEAWARVLWELRHNQATVGAPPNVTKGAMEGHLRITCPEPHCRHSGIYSRTDLGEAIARATLGALVVARPSRRPAWPTIRPRTLTLAR